MHQRTAQALRRGVHHPGSVAAKPGRGPAIALALLSDVDPSTIVVIGLVLFGVAFALNSSVHSFLILRYAHGDRVAMNVGFYYMANAGGRLAATVLSGAMYQWQGLEACLCTSVAFVLAGGELSMLLPRDAPPHVASASAA